MIVTSSKGVQEVANKALESKQPWVDFETEGLKRFAGDRICGTSVYIPETDESFYIPTRHKQGINAESIEAFRPLFENPDRYVHNHGIKFDVHMARAEGFDWKATPVCTMMGSHLLDENVLSSRKLEDLGESLLGTDAGAAEREMLEKIGKKDNIHKADPYDVAKYAEADVRTACALGKYMQPKLAEEKLLHLWRESCDYILATVDMEESGMLIDTEGVEREIEQLPAKLEACKMAVYVNSGGKIENPNSSPQVQRYFGSATSDREFLEKQLDPVAELVMEYRFLTRLKSNYFQAMLDNLDEFGYIHPNINLTGTVAGRPSCSGPNLQAIPRDDDKWGVKRRFIAPPGWKMVSFDLSQIELRLIAHYSKDKNLFRAYVGGEDIHQITADSLNVDRDFTAKRMNFSCAYGISANSLAPKIKRPVPETKSILSGWHDTYPNIRVLQSGCENNVRKNGGFIRMWTGRKKRYVWQSEYRKAMSGLIQGGVAEMMRIIESRRVWPLIRGYGHEIRNQIQVHDELLFRIREDRISYWVPILHEAITQGWPFDVPIESSCKVGDSWGTVKKWT